MKTKSVLILFVLTFSSSCTRVDSNYAEWDEYDIRLHKKISYLIQAVTEVRSSDIASICRFPLQRAYPVKDISDSADFVQRFTTIFDDEITKAIVESNPESWRGFGWRGYTLGEGKYIWLDDGEIYSIPYQSKTETLLRESLIEKDLRSLNPTLAKGWFPETCFIDTIKGDIYRIDCQSLDAMRTACRLMVFESDAEPDTFPRHITFGDKEIEGTAANVCYIFPNKKEIYNYRYENRIVLYENGKEVPLQKFYWLDLVAAHNNGNNTKTMTIQTDNNLSTP